MKVGERMKKMLGRKILLASITILMNMLMTSSIFAETVMTERFYSVDPKEEAEFEFREKFYGVLKLDISNVLSVEGKKIRVQSPADIRVVEEANGARLVGYKMTEEEAKEYDRASEEGLLYYENPETKLGYSVNNNRSVADTNSFTGERTISQVGTTITLTEEGYYFIYFGNGENQENEMIKVIEVVKGNAVVDPGESENLELKVIPTSARVMVNGQEISFDAYTIEGSNYFKLRDLAIAVRGTEKEFEVKWNNDKKMIELISNTPYTEVGGELKAGDGVEKIAILNSSAIYKDGQEIQLVAYKINDNTYFKLREIAEVFDIGVTWDEETRTIGIDTSIRYEIAEPNR